MDKASVKDITDVIGQFGHWQRTIFIVVFCLGLPAAWNHLIIAFYAPNVAHWCIPSEISSNFSQQSWGNVTWRRREGWQECRPPENLSSEKCDKWMYDHSFYSATIIEEWDLVCDRSFLVSLSQTIYMAGYIAGAVVLSQLSDRYGRRPVMLSSVFILFVSGIVCAFSPNFTIFAITRFLIALGRCGLYITAFVLLMETVGPDYRTVLGIARDFGWATGYIMIPGIAWLIRNWFYMQLAITIPVLGLVSLWWILSESPRWLLTQGKLEEAETVLKKAALINKRNVDNIKSDLEMLQASLQQNSTENRKKANIFDLLKSSNLRKKTIIICFCWYVNAFVFYGLSLNTNEIGGNPFLSFFIFGAVEFPAYIVSIFVVKYYGRRLPLMSTMVLGGLACIATIAVPEDLLWLRMTLSMLGKFCITSSYIIVYIFSAEIFPTVVRNVGVGTSSTFARIGSAIAPFVKELGQVTHLGVTFGLFGGLAIVSGLLALCLPETNKIVLPDTLEQGEQFGKKIRKIPSEHELEKF
ncbi:organic cation transporter protein-like isoform X1 [Centruroides sculpturatus]|uniref:organic cation transporter protein-like isoform X1 n=2 Tax=Centruroides sculpturatus TaxID=218467 RepID=UPI000C6E397D|nr:organic cation transporter protein-like isoform X1 [Centruroides sculpturatus]